MSPDPQKMLNQLDDIAAMIRKMKESLAAIHAAALLAKACDMQIDPDLLLLHTEQFNYEL